MESLCQHARKVFELAQVDSKGISIETHLRAAWKATKRKPPELNVPEIPLMVTYLWESYLDLRNGSELITFREISAYNDLTGAKIVGRDALTVRKLDRIWFEVKSEADDRRRTTH